MSYRETHHDTDFWINPKTGEMEYCSKCIDCKYDCKQSYRVKQIYCPKFEKAEN